MSKFVDRTGTTLFDIDSIPEVDAVPTQGSENAVSSGGTYDAIQNAGGGGGGDIPSETELVFTSNNWFDSNFDAKGYITGGKDGISGNYYRTTSFYRIPIYTTLNRNLYVNKPSSYDVFFAFYDIDKNYIADGRVYGTSNTIKIEDNYAFFRAFVPTAKKDIGIYVSLIPQEDVTDFSFTKTSKSVVRSDAFPFYIPTQNDFHNNIYNRVSYKKVVNLGDSIFGQIGDSTSVSSNLAKLSGMTVINGAFGGARMSDRGRDNDDATNWSSISFSDLAYSIAHNDWTLQDATIGQGWEGMPVYFPSRLDDLKAVDWNAVDLVTIAFGTNDYTSGITIEDVTPFNDTSSTFDDRTVIGALKQGIKDIQKAFPFVKILVITPIWRWFSNSGNADNRQIGGHTLRDYTEAIIDACKEMHVACLNAYDSLQLSIFNRNKYLADTTHLNEKGRKMYAELIDGAIRGLY